MALALVSASVSVAMAQDLTPIRPQPGAAPSMAVGDASTEAPRTPVVQAPGLVVSSAPTQTITVRSGVATVVKFGRVMKSVHIGDTKIVDFVPMNDLTGLVVSKAPGTTNIEVFDEKLQLINSLAIQVDDFPSYQTVVIHNKAKLASQTNFRCASDDCQYIGETTVEEPAPLPTGYSASKLTGLNPSAGGGAPSIAVPISGAK